MSEVGSKSETELIPTMVDDNGEMTVFMGPRPDVSNWQIRLVIGRKTLILPDATTAVGYLANETGMAPEAWLEQFKRVLARTNTCLFPLPDDLEQILAIGFATGLLTGGFRH